MRISWQQSGAAQNPRAEGNAHDLDHGRGEHYRVEVDSVPVRRVRMVEEKKERRTVCCRRGYLRLPCCPSCTSLYLRFLPRLPLRCRFFTHFTCAPFLPAFYAACLTHVLVTVSFVRAVRFVVYA
jgi:hypothetical protein